jgi:glycosyltransferase involved in cell wall biosynthesis
MTIHATNVTAAVVARNEEDQLEACLQALKFCAQIVVVIDSRSSDSSERIARQYADIVEIIEADRFDELKNAALRNVTCEWALFIDADERVTPSLAQEIVRVTSSSSVNSYKIPIRNYFFGRQMRFGGWTEKPVRLFRKEGSLFIGRIHETVSSEGAVGELSKPIWHFSHRSIQHNWEKTGRYLDNQAKYEFPSGWSPTQGAFLPVKVFLNRYIRLQGFRDGKVGFIEAVYQAASMFAVSVRAWELGQNPTVAERYAAFEVDITNEWEKCRSKGS